MAEYSDQELASIAVHMAAHLTVVEPEERNNLVGLWLLPLPSEVHADLTVVALESVLGLLDAIQEEAVVQGDLTSGKPLRERIDDAMLAGADLFGPLPERYVPPASFREPPEELRLPEGFDL